MFSMKLKVAFDHFSLQENPGPNFIPESSFVSTSFPKHPGPSRGGHITTTPDKGPSKASVPTGALSKENDAEISWVTFSFSRAG